MRPKISAAEILKRPWPDDEIQRAVDAAFARLYDGKPTVECGFVDPKHKLHGDGGRKA